MFTISEPLFMYMLFGCSCSTSGIARVCVNVYYHVAFDNIFMFLCSKPKKKSDFFGNLKGLVIMLSTKKEASSHAIDF